MPATDPAHAHLFSSNSFHTFCIFSLFSLAASRFCFVRSSRRPRRHMLTLYFASVQFPVTFQMKPRLWHSSSAATTSAQSIPWMLEGVRCGLRGGGRVAHSFGLLRCVDGDALWICAGCVVCEGRRCEVWETWRRGWWCWARSDGYLEIMKLPTNRIVEDLVNCVRARAFTRSHFVSNA